MANTGYTVCWTCRGLLRYDEWRQINEHIEKCNDNCATGALLFEYYICDQQDFHALKKIKKYLAAEHNIFLNRRKDLLGMGFSHEFIDLLLNLNRCKVNEKQSEKQQKVNQENESRENNVVVLSLPKKNTSSGKEIINGLNISASSLKSVTNLNDILLTQEEKNVLADHCVSSKHEINTELECKLCGYKSRSSKIMLRHLPSHDNGHRFVCSNCNFSTLLRSKWNRHQCRNCEKNLSCKICSQTFQTRALLSHHVATEHKSTEGNPSKSFKCKECPYVGRDMSSLSDHQRKHTGEYLICDQPDCTFKTPYKRSLQQHLQQKHATEKAVICHVCGFQTKHVTSLRKHMKLHEETKQYKCAQCPFSSHNSTDVVLHTQRKHLKEKKYSCSQCGFQTGYAMALKKHLARHEKMQTQLAEGNENKKTRQAKQYICSFCNEVFKTMAKMKKHIGQCNQIALQVTPNLKTDHNVYEEFDKNEIYFDNEMDVDMSAEVYSITSNMINQDNSRKESFTSIVEDSLGNSQLEQEGYGKKESDSVTCKGRNPMLAETTRTLAESPLLEESLFNLMSDFPRPPNLNRCQSASTLMFASLSPHLVDRPLTPDIFSENPASSFFQSLSRNMDQDNLTVSSLNQSFSTPLNF